MDAKIEWARITNPFSQPAQTQAKPKPATVAQKLRMALTGRGEK